MATAPTTLTRGEEGLDLLDQAIDALKNFRSIHRTTAMDPAMQAGMKRALAILFRPDVPTGPASAVPPAEVRPAGDRRPGKKKGKARAAKARAPKTRGRKAKARPTDLEPVLMDLLARPKHQNGLMITELAKVIKAEGLWAPPAGVELGGEIRRVVHKLRQEKRVLRGDGLKYYVPAEALAGR